jgi:Acetyltransferase (GNAT) domain
VLQEPRIQQPGVALDELVEGIGGPTLAVDGHAAHPAIGDGCVVLVRGAVRGRHVTDRIRDDRAGRIRVMIFEAPPAELQMLPVTEALAASENLIQKLAHPQNATAIPKRFVRLAIVLYLRLFTRETTRRCGGGVCGQRFATEAVAAVIRIAFEDLGLRRVVAVCYADNERSWQLMERVGMRREGHSIRSTLHRDGTWHDFLFYGLLAPDA